MRDDYNYDNYYASQYNDIMYKKHLSSTFFNKGHMMVEKPFSEKMHFSRCVEIGSGTGAHIKFVKHSYDEYVMTEYSMPAVEFLKKGDFNNKISIIQADARKLPMEDNSVDRIIAVHVLEHISNPELALREWNRVVKPNGVISIVLPTDPGMLWRLIRTLFAHKNAKKNGLAFYDYFMAREHVNPLNNLIAFIRYYFSDISESWYPLHVPSIDLNLYYVCNITLTDKK